MKRIKSKIGELKENFFLEDPTMEDIQEGFKISNSSYLVSIVFITLYGFEAVNGSPDPWIVFMALATLWAGSFTREKALERTLKGGFDLSN